jgi:hypothetical protein
MEAVNASKKLLHTFDVHASVIIVKESKLQHTSIGGQRTNFPFFQQFCRRTEKRLQSWREFLLTMRQKSLCVLSFFIGHLSRSESSGKGTGQGRRCASNWLQQRRLWRLVASNIPKGEG